jgi:HEAT repeat protein
MTTHHRSRGRACRFLAALFLVLASLPAQQPPGPPPGSHSGTPPFPKLPPDRRRDAQEDPARWERWWYANKDDFLVARAVLAPDVVGDAYTGTLAAPTEQEVRTKVIPVLIGALADTDHSVRTQAALALGKVGDWREMRTLVAALKDRERGVVEAAIVAIGLLGEPAAEAAIRDVMNDTTRTARERAIAAIALGYSGGDDARAALFDRLGTTVDAEGRSRVPAIEAARLLGAALWAGADRKDRASDRSPLVAAILQRALSAPQLKDRVILAIGSAALSKPRDPGSLEFVLRGLADSRSEIRAGCGIAAGRVIKADDRRSVRALTAAIDAEADPSSRRLMLISLGRIGGPDARKWLIEEMDGNLRQDRAFAGLALGVSGATDLASRLRREFETASDDSLRGAMAIALGLMHDPEALKLVSEVARTKGNPELLRHLMWFFALDRGRGSAPMVKRILDESRTSEVHDAGCLALGLTGEIESQNILIRQLSSDAPARLRGSAAIGLGRMGDSRAIAPLVAIAGTTHEPQLVRAAAIAGLGILCQKDPWPPLSRVTIDSHIDVPHEALDRIAELP